MSILNYFKTDVSKKRSIEKNINININNSKSHSIGSGQDDSINDAESLSDQMKSMHIHEEQSPKKACENHPALSINIYNKNLKPVQPNIAFPRINKRSFVRSWYSNYDWIEYSISTNKVFCFCCRMLSSNKSSISIDIDTNTLKKLSKHAESMSHQTNNEKYKLRILTDSNKIKSVASSASMSACS